MERCRARLRMKETKGESVVVGEDVDLVTNKDFCTLAGR